jgi:surface-adhesin protein E
MNVTVYASTLFRYVATSLVAMLVACASPSPVISPWVVVTEGDRATVSLDTSRIEARAPGYRVHIQTQFTEPAYRPKIGGPAYDLAEASLDIDCIGRRARSLEATVFDSLRQPVHREAYQAQWQDFPQHDLGEIILADLCRVLTRVRPGRVA